MNKTYFASGHMFIIDRQELPFGTWAPRIQCITLSILGPVDQACRAWTRSPTDTPFLSWTIKTSKIVNIYIKKCLNQNLTWHFSPYPLSVRSTDPSHKALFQTTCDTVTSVDSVLFPGDKDTQQSFVWRLFRSPLD